MTRRILCISTLFLLATAALRAQAPPTVHTRLIPDTVWIGDHFRMEVEINHDQAQDLQIASFENKRISKDIEILDGPKIDTVRHEGRNLVLRLTYTLTTFEEGLHIVTGYPVVYSQTNTIDTVKSEDMTTLYVNTFEIDTTKQTIYDIKTPLKTPLQFAEIKDYVFMGLIAAAILATIIYLIVRHVARRKGKIRRKPDEPPHITAIRELERLLSEKVWQNGRHKEYYSRLTDIIREYLEGRYGIGAMEMTSPEIMAAVADLNSDKLKDKLRELFYLADLVKFAKLQPSPEENEQSYYDAYFYVEETKLIAMEPVYDGTQETAEAEATEDNE